MKKVIIDPLVLLWFLVCVSVVAYAATRGMEHLAEYRQEKIDTQLFEAQKAVDPAKVPLARMAGSVANDFKRGTLSGVWMQDSSVKVGPRMNGERRGNWIITPLLLNDGTSILVNRGWVSEPMTPLMLEGAPTPGVVTLTGTLHRSDINGTRLKEDDPKGWSAVNVDAIANANAVVRFMPLYLFMETSQPEEEDFLSPVPAVWQKADIHLNKAVFWLGLAAVLGVFYFLTAVQPVLSRTLHREQA